MTNQYEFEGKTVDDAIADGLIRLGLSRDQVDVEILHKGNRGIFGIGSEPAVVRLVPHSLSMAQEPPSATTAPEAEVEASVDSASQPDAPEGDEAPPAPKAERVESAEPAEGTSEEDAEQPSGSPEADAPEAETPVAELTPEEAVGVDEEDEFADDEISRAELTNIATELLDKMINLMGFTVSIEAEWQEPEEEDEDACLLLNVEGDELGPLIGRNGETLANIQYLLRLMINQRIREWRNIVVDIAGYKARRTEKITQLARRMAQQVSDTGRAIALEPMPSNERRVIHMALRDHPDVYTQSTGEADHRKVNIFPRRD